MSARVTVNAFLLPIDPGARSGSADLPHEDQVRASLLRSPEDRERFCLTRRLLRYALERRAGLAGESIRLVHGPNGKPYLRDGGPSLSLAHSGSWCAVALSDDCPVGIDLEELVPHPSLELVTVLMPAEARDEITAEQPRERLAATLRWWVRMEAAVKACGARLDDAAACLNTVRTADVPQTGLAAAVAARTHSPLVARWSLVDPAAVR